MPMVMPVILSAGAISSPQLLLLSGIGPKQDLERVGIPVIHDLPGVGQNLHNHVASYITFKLQKETAKHRLDWVNVLEYMLNRRGSMSSTGMSQVTGILNSKFADPDGQHPDLQFFFRGFYAGCSRTGAVDEVSDPEHPEAVETLTITPVVLHPKSRGYLTLRNSDPLEHPMLFPNYLSAEEDVNTLVEGIKIALKFGESKSLQDRWGIELDKSVVKECLQAGEWGSDGYWKCVVRVITGPENHQVGTCKMGDSNDPTAVVDPELKVIGVKGLRVMDCSIIPIVPSGNTAAPAIMIAERGAVFIHNTWDTNKPPQVFSRFSADENNNNNQINNNQNGYVAPTNNNNQQGYGAATNSNNQYGHTTSTNNNYQQGYTTPKNNYNQQTANTNNKWDANSNKWDTNSNNQHAHTTPTNNYNQQTTNANNKWNANSNKWDTNSNNQHGHAAPANGNNWDRNSNHHNGQAWDPNNKWDTNHNNQHSGAWDPNSHKWDTNHHNQHGRAWDPNANKWDTNHNNQHGAWDPNNKWDTNNNQHGHA